MLGRTRRRKAECAGLEAFLEQLPHACDLIFGRTRAVIRAPIAHYVKPQRRVGDLSANIHHARRFL